VVRTDVEERTEPVTRAEPVSRAEASPSFPALDNGSVAVALPAPPKPPGAPLPAAGSEAKYVVWSTPPAGDAPHTGTEEP
jgi:hypothetical protein